MGKFIRVDYTCWLGELPSPDKLKGYYKEKYEGVLNQLKTKPDWFRHYACGILGILADRMSYLEKGEYWENKNIVSFYQREYWRKGELKEGGYKNFDTKALAIYLTLRTHAELPKQIDSINFKTK